MSGGITNLLADWADEETMYEYFQAVFCFRNILFQTLKQVPNVHLITYVGPSTENLYKYINRSEDAIILPVTYFHGQVHRVGRLITPFGSYRFLDGGSNDVLEEVSQKLIDNLHKVCDLVDITSEIQRFDLDLRGQGSVKSVKSFGDDKSSYFLLKFKENLPFADSVKPLTKDYRVYMNIIDSEENQLENIQFSLLTKFTKGSMMIGI